MIVLGLIYGLAQLLRAAALARALISHTVDPVQLRPWFLARFALQALSGMGALLAVVVFPNTRGVFGLAFLIGLLDVGLALISRSRLEARKRTVRS